MKSRQKKHFWIDLIVVVAGIACGLALLIASLGAAAGAAAGETEPVQTITPQNAAPQTSTLQTVAAQTGDAPENNTQQTYEGIVTCSTCGAKHSARIGKNASDCARMCVHGGASFALVDGEKTYLLNGDLDLLKHVAGQRAQIVGAIRGNTITVSTIVAAS